jgi:hypothetical protein
LLTIGAELKAREGKLRAKVDDLANEISEVWRQRGISDGALLELSTYCRALDEKSCRSSGDGASDGAVHMTNVGGICQWDGSHCYTESKYNDAATSAYEASLRATERLPSILKGVSWDERRFGEGEYDRYRKMVKSLARNA